MEDVVADAVRLHPQWICVLTAVGLDDQPRGGPMEVDTEPLHLLLASPAGGML